MTFLIGSINALLKKKTSYRIFIKQVHRTLLHTFLKIPVVPKMHFGGGNHFFDSSDTLKESKYFYI